MSALRLSHPGQPTRLIDLGPSTGRITHTRGAITGGAVVEAVKVTWKQARKDAAAARQESKR